MLRIRTRIRIIFQDSDPSAGCLGSGSICYSHEHNKTNWKGELNKEYLLSLLCGSCWTYWQVKWSEDVLKSTEDPDQDPYQTVGSGSVSKWKAGYGSKGSVSATLIIGSSWSNYDVFLLISVADPDPFDMDLDHAFNFYTDPDPAVWYGSGSLLFQIVNEPKTLLIHTTLLDFPCQ